MHIKHKFGVPFGQFEIEYDGNIKEVMQQVSQVFEALGHNYCGHCDSENIQPNVREVEGNKYYSILCKDCYHSLSMGQYKKGDGLFAKRGQGWTKYVKPEGEEGDETPENKEEKPKRKFGK